MAVRSLIVSLAILSSVAQAKPYEIQHVEPLNWWVGMKHPELQVMVHAENIAGLTPTLNYPGVSLNKVERTDNKNFVFLDLNIAPTARAGTLSIQFRRGNAVVATVPYALQTRRKDSARRRSFDSSDAVYLLMPDRFSNGDPSNDRQAGMDDIVDRAQDSARHGGDIAGMKKHLDYIGQMGFTMVWPTPLLENNQKLYSYHGYSLTNYYSIDKRYGSNEEYKDYVASANQLGIGIIQDVVVNHIGTGHWWMKDMPAADWLNFPKAFVPTNNQHSTVQDIHASPEDLRLFSDGWFADTMPDVNQRNPLVARYLMQNSVWWIEYANLSGIREDTYSYADKYFLANWCQYILEEYPHFNIVGEEMNPNPHLLAYWQKGVKNRDGYRSGLPSLMDFPVADIMPDVLNGEESWDSGWHRLYEMIANDFVYADPMQLMIFPDNHDRSRIFSLLHENLDLFKTSLLFTATTRGIPQIFYGTETLTKSPIIRDDGKLRADFPGGWEGDKVNAFTGQGLSDQQRDAQSFVRKLFQWRKTNSAVTKGKLTHYIPENGTYVYFRYDDHKTVMVVLNKNKQASSLDLSRFQRVIQTHTRAKNIITDDVVSLTKPLQLLPLQSVVLEF